MNEAELSSPVEERRIRSMREFFELVQSTFVHRPVLLYRGQANYEWPLRSRLHRWGAAHKRKNMDGDNPEYFLRPAMLEQQHLAAFKLAIRGRNHVVKGSRGLGDDDYWALGQHHGLATPLLDFTRSPFVALYFAFENQYYQDGQKLVEPTCRGVYAVSVECCKARPLRIISLAGDVDARLVAQGGVHVNITEDRHVEECVRESCAGREGCEGAFWKIKLEGLNRHDVLAMLDKMNINRMTLFPDLDGAAEYVNSLWLPAHENSYISC